MSNPRPKAAKRENLWLNLGCNMVLPMLLLSKGDDWFGWNAATGLVVALAFPLGYGVYDFLARKKTNFFSVLGLVGILLTGGIGLLRLPAEWVAIKEASLPLALGIAVLVSLRTPFPLVKQFLLNPDLIDVEKIHARVAEKGATEKMESLLRESTLWVAGSFLLSAGLNYLLAIWVVRSPSGTDAFNAELARMQGLSYVVILLPSMAVLMVALMRLFQGIQRITGASLEDFLWDQPAQPPQPGKASADKPGH